VLTHLIPKGIRSLFLYSWYSRKDHPNLGDQTKQVRLYISVNVNEVPVKVLDYHSFFRFGRSNILRCLRFGIWLQ
jgi:hypothetical protein